MRRFFFWLHLVAGVVAGSIIAVMCFTGALLAFEHEIVEWAERDARDVTLPGEIAQRRSLNELIANARAVKPEATVTGITVSSDPTKAVAVSFGRDAAVYVDPYTGEAREPKSTAVHDFMHLMTDWHRWLAMSGDNRATGKAITGACNTAFLVLGLTGLYLWWPRRWTWRVLKPSVWFTGSRGKARDWNWHNVIGFWTLPVLIVLTASGMVISYRWASNLVYQAFGEAPPQQQGPGAMAGVAREPIAPPAPDARPLPQGALLEAAQLAAPNFDSITLRLGNPRAGRGGASASAAQAPASTELRGEGANQGPRGVAPVNVSVREKDQFPTFGSTTLVLNPFTGAVVDRSGFSDMSSGRQARMWLRWLHVGQGFGWVGQLIALIACVGGLVLVYTGFALAWRRFFPRRPKRVTVTVAQTKTSPTPVATTTS